MTKPTTSGGLDKALAKLKEFAKPRRKRLLLVEDDEGERLGVAELLGHEDIDIVSAGTGADALRLLREDSPDCIVLDLKLPDMTGFEVLEQIRDDDAIADVPVVVFTGRELSPEEDA